MHGVAAAWQLLVRTTPCRRQCGETRSPEPYSPSALPLLPALQAKAGKGKGEDANASKSAGKTAGGGGGKGKADDVSSKGWDDILKDMKPEDRKK